MTTPYRSRRSSYCSCLSELITAMSTEPVKELFPPPRRPQEMPRNCSRRCCHCRKRTLVWTMIKALRPISASKAAAMTVLPKPVGADSTPKSCLTISSTTACCSSRSTPLNRSSRRCPPPRLSSSVTSIPLCRNTSNVDSRHPRGRVITPSSSSAQQMMRGMSHVLSRIAWAL